MATHSSILAGKSHGLAGYSPWGRKELDTTEGAEQLGATTIRNRERLLQEDAEIKQ